MNGNVMLYAFIALAFVRLVLMAIANEPEIANPLDAFIQPPVVDKCYEYHYWHENACPEGYGPVTVNTPNSDRQSIDAGGWCKESFGVVVDCGRIVEEK